MQTQVLKFNLKTTMKKVILLLAAIVLTLPLYSQDGGQRELAVIINMEGAAVYEHPGFDSQQQALIPTGAILVVEERIGTQEKLKLGEGFALTGEWVKPVGTEGYIFSSDLSSKRVSTGRNESGQPFIDLLGSLTREERKEELVATPAGEFPKVVVQRFYENGTQSLTYWDGCVDEVAEYRGLALNEVYHQLVSDHGLFMGDGSYEIPLFTEKVGNEWRFENPLGPTQGIVITLQEDGALVVSAYSCD